MGRINGIFGAALGVVAAVALAGPASAQTKVWRASHQFPGGKGDVRDDMVQMIAKRSAAANVGLDIQVYPGASLFKPNDQWNAMVNGQLDITLFPLDYASGKVPAFSATLMPGLIRSPDRAKRIDALAIHEGHPRRDRESRRHRAVGRLVRRRHGVEEGLHREPSRPEGPEVPRRGTDFRRDVGGGRRQHRQPPSNEIYNAFQSGVVKATDTSLGTFQSMRLYEVTNCLTAPGNNALWLMYEPVLMSKKSFDKLNKAQQAAVLKAGKDGAGLLRRQGRRGE